MRLSFIIAWRNIRRHKGKSLVIGMILFLGALIMTAGNAVISGMDRGLQENIVNRFTGHIVLVTDKHDSDNVFFLPMGKSVPVMTDYLKTRELLKQQNYIESFLPIGRGFTLILNEEGDMSFAMLLGVDFPQYQKMFHENVNILEGRGLEAGERGALITQKNRSRFYDDQNYWLLPAGNAVVEKNLSEEARKNLATLPLRDNIVLMGSSDDNTSVDIRSPVRGIVEYQFLNDFWGFFNIIDIESFRETFHYVTAADSEVSIPAEKKILLTETPDENLDDIFSDNVVSQSGARGQEYNISAMLQKNKTNGKVSDIDSGSYNVVLIKIKNGQNLQANLDELNRKLRENNLPVKAVSWKSAVGQMADMAMIIRGALFGFVMFIFFVAIIIIMNTLSMAAMERINEIGMMRAVGARRNFVASMFFMESAFLSALFGGGGIVAGAVLVYAVNQLQLTTDNNILQLLYGGKVFHPLLDGQDILLGIAELAVVTLLATLYPILVARKITPLEAIARD